MAEVTLETILQELKTTRTELGARIDKTEARMERNEAREEDRFQFIKESFQGLQSEFHSFRSETTQRFDQVDRSLELLAGQTQKHISEIKSLDQRVSRLENPIA